MTTKKKATKPKVKTIAVGKIPDGGLFRMGTGKTVWKVQRKEKQVVVSSESSNRSKLLAKSTRVVPYTA